MLSNEWKLPKCFLSDGNTKLIRVNPDDDEDEGVIKLKLGSMKAMKIISTNLKIN